MRHPRTFLSLLIVGVVVAGCGGSNTATSTHQQQNAQNATTATGQTAPTTTHARTTPARTTPTTTTSSPPPCGSSHNPSARCATAAVPYCQQGQCSYPAPASGGCAPGYTETTAPSTSSRVCQRPVAGVTTTTPFTPTPDQVAKAQQALAECQRLQPGITLQQLEREAANPEGIQC